VETLAQFQRTAVDERFAVRAYCFTPDHVHLLVKGVAPDSDLRQFAKLSKQRSGYAHAKACGAQLWQEGYFERVIRDEDDARQYARYIVTNPVRAGLVTVAGEYAFLGVTGWTLDELTKGAVHLGVPRRSRRV
jgi:REP element-mobilizing transposase RayT